MRNRCEAFEEAIWDHVRFGTDLPADTRAHIDICAQCARTLNEARQLAGVVVRADCVPPAPDCRSAVMARIAPRQRQPRFAWAYACAAVAIASIAIGGIMSLGPGNKPADRSVAKVEPKLIPPAPNRDIGIYSNTGERYNPPSKEPGQPARPKEPAQTMVASAVVAPNTINTIITDAPAPETRTVIGWDGDAYTPSAEATPPSADAAAAAPAAAPSAPAASMVATMDSVSIESKSSVGMTYYFDTANDKDSLPKEGARRKLATVINGSLALGANFSTKAGDALMLKTDMAKPADDYAMIASAEESRAREYAWYGSPVLSDKWRSAEVLDRSAVGTPLIFSVSEPPADDDKKPIAMVVASWSQQQPQPASYGYNYTDVDTVTGRTTTVSVKRSGNHVEVRLEGNKPPVKGSVSHATTPNA